MVPAAAGALQSRTGLGSSLRRLAQRDSKVLLITSRFAASKLEDTVGFTSRELQVVCVS